MSGNNVHGTLTHVKHLILTLGLFYAALVLRPPASICNASGEVHAPVNLMKPATEMFTAIADSTIAKHASVYSGDKPPKHQIMYVCEKG